MGRADGRPVRDSRIQSWGGAGLPFRGVFAGDPRHSAKVGAVGAMTRTWPDGEISRSGDPRSGDDAAIDEGGLGGASASALFMARWIWSRCDSMARSSATEA